MPVYCVHYQFTGSGWVSELIGPITVQAYNRLQRHEDQYHGYGSAHTNQNEAYQEANPTE